MNCITVLYNTCWLHSNNKYYDINYSAVMSAADGHGQ